MAIYTLQQCSESGSFAAPSGTNVYHAANLADLDWYLDNWEEQHDRVGSDSAGAQLLVWRGRLDDVTDVYPDFLCRRGPRGGLIREAV
jgi:hypothetical protein